MTEGRKPALLAWAVALTLSFAAIEAITGYWSNSLALMSDAGHMLTDSISLGLALLAQLLARRPPSPTNSFGLGRTEAIAAFINGLAMLAVVAWIALEALDRLSSPQMVEGATVFVVALIGLSINLIVAALLAQDRKSINTRAALVHVFGDLLGSLAALTAGAVIYLTGWMTIDPLLSLLVCLLILKSTIAILRESYHFLMEGVPRRIDYLQVGTDLEAVEGVISVHDLHIWEMTPGEVALTGHVEVIDMEDWPKVLQAIRLMLLEKHGIEHVTLQAELPSGPAKD